MTLPTLPEGEWQEVTPEDWDEDELEDGRRFLAALEVREWDESGGYVSRYWAVIEEALE